MDEEKKIMEKRSSFRGWKERNKENVQQKKNTIAIIIAVSIFFVLMIYPYLNKVNDNVNDNNNSSSIDQQNNTTSPIPIKDIKTNKSVNTSIKTVNNISKKVINTTNTVNTTNISKKIIIGKIGVPLINNGFEITVKSVTPANLRTNVWIYVRNIDNDEKPFKLGPGTVMIDNIGQQYENVGVARSAEIAQTNLSSQAMREGAIFFDALKEGRSAKKLTLNINNEKVEFVLDNKTNI